MLASGASRFAEGPVALEAAGCNGKKNREIVGSGAGLIKAAGPLQC